MTLYFLYFKYSGSWNLKAHCRLHTTILYPPLTTHPSLKDLQLFLPPTRRKPCGIKEETSWYSQYRGIRLYHVRRPSVDTLSKRSEHSNEVSHFRSLWTYFGLEIVNWPVRSYFYMQLAFDGKVERTWKLWAERRLGAQPRKCPVGQWGW